MVLIMRLMKTTNKKEIHLIELILPFFHLFSQYSVWILSLGSIILMLVAGLSLAMNSWKLRFSASYKPYLIFLGYVVTRDIFRAFLGPDLFQTQINRMIEYIFIYFLVFIICSQSLDEDKLYKVWKIAGVIYVLGLLIQVIQIYFLGQRIAPISIIPGYELRPEGNIAQLRPSSFFAEPASFVIAMLPLEFLSIKRKDYKWAVFTTISILLSASTVGIILSVILWASSLLSKDTSIKRKLIILLLAVSIVGLFINMDVFDTSLSKFLQVASGESTFVSRVQNGFDVIRRQSILSFIFGTNYNDVQTFVSDNLSTFSSSPLLLTYWRNHRIFLNTFSRLIFQYGLIGLLLYILPLITYLKNKRYVAKPLVIMMLVAIFGQTMLLNTYYFTMVMILILYDNQSEFELEGM